MFINMTIGNWTREFWIGIILRQCEINESPLAWLGWTIQILEILSIIITFLTFWFSFMAFRKKIFGHPNVTRIMLAFLLDGYVLVVSRVYLIVYQHVDPNVLRVSPELGYPKPIVFDLFLLVGTFFRQFYVYSTLLSMVIIVLERALAFHFLEDYEKSRRRWIDTLLLSIKYAACALMSFLNIIGWVSNTYAVVLCTFLFVMSILGFARLHALNKRKTVEIKCARVLSRYTLSLRYQIMENERVLKMITGVFGAMIFCGIVQLVIALMTSAFIPLSSVAYDLLQAAFETSVAITANVIIIAAISQMPGAWAGLKRRAMRRKVQVSPVVAAAPSRGEDQTKLYFQQLSQSWQ